MSSSAIGATGAIAALPAGVMIDYAATVAPAGWLMCDGSAVSRTTFASLFATISTTYGVGDGSTTFNLPDFRGRFARYMDNMGTPAGAAGRDTGRVLGATAQTDSTKRPTTSLTTGNESVGHTHGIGGSVPINGGSTAFGAVAWLTGNAVNTTTTMPGTTTGVSANHTHTVTGGGDAETRPINLACNRIIKV